MAKRPALTMTAPMPKPEYRFVFAYLNRFNDIYNNIFEIDGPAPENVVYLKSKSPYFFHFRILGRTHSLQLPFRWILRKAYWRKESNAIIKAFHTMPSNAIPCLVVNQWFLEEIHTGAFALIKKEFPSLKIVYYFSDLVVNDSERMQICNNPKEANADLLLSYDKTDARTYGMVYCPLPYSKLPITLRRHIKVKRDICFVGVVKDRWKEILEAYDYLSGKGLRCDFYIVNANHETLEHREGIHQISFISYKDYIKLESESRYVLEIIQKKSSGSTLRVAEAVFLGKRLITNNPALKNDSRFHPGNMRVYEQLSDLDDEFLTCQTDASYSNEFREQFSLLRVLECIQENLSAQN